MAIERSRRKSRRALGLALSVAIAAGGGCNKTAAPPPTGQVTIAFDHEVSGVPLTLHSARYRNAAGNDYNVADLRYYVSGLELVRGDATAAAGPAIFYRDEGVQETHQLVVAVPSGDYVALRFTFGVDAAHNHLHGLSDAVENLNMQWPDVFGGGYHYMQLDGLYTGSTGEVGWLAHLGRLQRDTDPVALDPGFRVELPLTLHVTNDAWTLHVVMDVNAWFAAPTLYDFGSLGGPAEMSDPAALRALHDNGAHVFQIGAVDHGAP